MAPNTPATTPAATPAAATTTTIGGHAIQILAFIPDNKADLREQSRLLELLADVKDGKKSIADLTPFLKAVEVKANYTRKRFTEAEAKALFTAKVVAAAEGQTDIEDEIEKNKGGEQSKDDLIDPPKLAGDKK